MRKVIYTSLVGNYDTLKDPMYIMEGWDYICFSNNLNQKKFKVWKIIPIPYKDSDKGRLSRYVKIQPHKVLSDYDVSLYIDANIEITSYKVENTLNELITKNINLAIPRHPFRECIYDEAKECERLGREKKFKIKKQIKFLKSEGYPIKNGLFENNIIFRKHNAPVVMKVNNLWWEIFNKYTKRDQLSLAYVIWKLNVKCYFLFEKNFNVRNDDRFNFIIHKKKHSVKIRHKIRFFIGSFIKPILHKDL